jgi:hypothetical protein
MKKYFIFSIFLAGLFLAFSAVAHAQSNTAYSSEAAPPPHVIAAPPATKAHEQTISTTQQKQTQESSADNTASSQDYYQNLNLPQPELPVINLDTATQETAVSTPTPNIDTHEIAKSVLGPLMDNQLKIVLVVFLGAISGAILSLLLLFLVRVIGRHSK